MRKKRNLTKVFSFGPEFVDDLARTQDKLEGRARISVAVDSRREPFVGEMLRMTKSGKYGTRQASLKRSLARGSGVRAAMLGIAVAIIPACTSSPAANFSPGSGSLLLVPYEGYYYPAVQTGEGEIETNPPRVAVELMGSGMKLSPFVSSVIEIDEDDLAGLQPQRVSSGVWEPIGTLELSGGGFALDGQRVEASSLRFEKRDEVGGE